MTYNIIRMYNIWAGRVLPGDKQNARTLDLRLDV